MICTMGSLLTTREVSPLESPTTNAHTYVIDTATIKIIAAYAMPNPRDRQKYAQKKTRALG
jgi:hypothetical protein